MRVGAAERPARGAEAEAERGAAERGEHEELLERHAHDPCRNRDERARERRREPDRHRPVVETVEPPLRAVELRVRDVHVAAVAVQQRTASERADPPADRGAHEVPNGAGGGDGDICPHMRVDGRAEHVHRNSGEGAACDGTCVQHHQLARDRDDGC